MNVPTSPPPETGMLLSMLKLQDGMNAKINPDWRAAGYAFLRAVMVESVEAMEHHGWKWWNNQQPDMPQLRIELIDIWHFVLSHYLVSHKGHIDVAADALQKAWEEAPSIAFDGGNYVLNTLSIVEKLELLGGLASVRRTSIVLLADLFTACGLATEDLYRAYLSKNVLNHFRQDRGYKTGAYKKWWDGREDNEHLAEIFSSLDVSSPALADELYDALDNRYDELTRAGRTRSVA